MKIYLLSFVRVNELLLIMFLTFSVTACKITENIGSTMIESQYVDDKEFKLYYAPSSFSSMQRQSIKVRILRTPLSLSREVRESHHKFEATLNKQNSYRVMSKIEDDMLVVWLVDGASLETVSTISSTPISYDKITVLKQAFQDPKKRIHLVLNNSLEDVQHVYKINKRKPRYD